MKINNKAIVIVFAAVTLISCGKTDPENLSARHKQVEKRFQSNQEKTAKDAVWTAKNIFKVGVFDNGNRRDGYAQYVCQVLYGYGFKGRRVWVQIIDIIKLTRDGKWIKLGEARCQ